MGKRKVCSKGVMDRQGAVGILKGLLAGIESGEIVVGEGKEQLSVGVPEEMKVSLKGKVKGPKAKVSVSLSWKHGGETPVVVEESGPPAEKQQAEPPAKKAKPTEKAKSEKKVKSAKKDKADAKAPKKAKKAPAAKAKKEPAAKAKKAAAKKDAK